MPTGYSRQSSGVIINGNTIQASHFNNEYNAILDFANATTGHNHDGTAGGGAPISLTTSVTGTLPIANGGTGATTAATARTALDVVDAASSLTDNRIVRGDGGSKGIQTSAVTIDDTGAVSGITTLTTTGNITGGNDATLTGGMYSNFTQATAHILNTTGYITSDSTATNYFDIGAWDVDGDALKSFIRLTSANTPTCDLDTGVTINSSYIYRAGGTDIPVTDGGTGSSTAAGARTNLGAAATTQTDSFSVFIEAPQNKSYPIIIKNPTAFTITNITSKSSTGTCTATTKIDTVALGGTANSVSTSEQDQAHASDNTVSVGADLDVVLSSVSSCENVTLTFTITKTLS